MIERKYEPATAVEHLYQLITGLTARLRGPMVSLAGPGTVARPPVGTNTYAEFKIELNRVWETPVTVSYSTTSGGTALGSSGKLSFVGFDEANDNIPFLVQYDDSDGGRIVFDGGFPKFYNSNILEAGGTTSAAAIFAGNVVKWLGRATNRNVLLLTTADGSLGNSTTLNNGFGNDLPNSLRDRNHTVTVQSVTELLGPATDITLANLTGYDVVILIDGGGSVLTTNSVQAVTDYVNQGGGLFIVHDHHPEWTQSAGPIALNFNVEIYGSFDRSPAVDLDVILAQGADTLILEGLAGMTWPALSSEGGHRVLGPTQEYLPTSGLLLFEVGETEKTVQVLIAGNEYQTDDTSVELQIFSEWLIFQGVALAIISNSP